MVLMNCTPDLSITDFKIKGYILMILLVIICLCITISMNINKRCPEMIQRAEERGKRKEE